MWLFGGEVDFSKRESYDWKAVKKES